jgi:formylglycine-generating enzyme required for sulfatase activity
LDSKTIRNRRPDAVQHNRSHTSLEIGMLRLVAVIGLLNLTSLARADLPTEKECTNLLGMKFVRIAPGEFTMGEGAERPKTRAEFMQRDWDEAPAHKVKITKPFYIGIHEVTNAQYEQFDPKHKDLRGKNGASKGDDEPVTFVTWQQAADFCKWLSKKEGQPYRFPTEAEWEYCCRAGTKTPYSTGEKITAEQANLALPGPVAVGSYKPNPWGIFDMHGNVAEWCNDSYDKVYYKSSPASNPRGPTAGSQYVLRGGAWKSGAEVLRSSYRLAENPGFSDACLARDAIGFRCVRKAPNDPTKP